MDRAHESAQALSAACRHKMSHLKLLQALLIKSASGHLLHQIITIYMQHKNTKLLHYTCNNKMKSMSLQIMSTCHSDKSFPLNLTGSIKQKQKAVK